MFAVTSIKGVGRRYANVVLKKADIDLTKRAGELSEEEVMSCGTFFHYSCTIWHLLCITGGEIDNNHGKSTSVQDPWLVFEQTKGYQGWQVLSGNLLSYVLTPICVNSNLVELGYIQHAWEQTPWRFGKT